MESIDTFLYHLNWIDLMLRLPSLPLLLVVLSATLSGCIDATPTPPSEPESLEVGTIELTPERILFTADLPGRIESTRVAEVRARVPGIVLERNFQEGSDVEAGQLLFKIDPAPFQSDVQEARANLEQDKATLAEAELLERRYSQLVGKAISQHDYDQAVTRRTQAQARVAQAEAALRRTELDLEYATVRAPISGRIGRALVTEGALVGQGEATPLATIQTLDPVYVNITQSTNELLQLRDAFSNGDLLQIEEQAAPVTIQLSNGRQYSQTGKLLFSDITVNPATGQVTLRAEVPNPAGVLLPGMYVRATVQQGVQEDSLAVPAQAVLRDSNGAASVMLVADNGTVERRKVETGAMKGDRWIIERGLQAGDIIAVDRLQEIQSGMKVTAVPWRSPLVNTLSATVR